MKKRGQVSLENPLSDEITRKIRIKRILRISIVISILIVIILIGIVFYFKSPEKQFGIGANIEQIVIAGDGKNAYVKLSAGINSGNITEVKFIFKDKNKGEYNYSTSEGMGNISISYDSHWWNFLIKPKFSGTYDYVISSSQIGLINFNDIIEVSVSFKYKTQEGKEVETPKLDTKKPTTPKTSSGGGGGGGGSGGGDTPPIVPPICTPVTCSKLGKTCGIYDNSCGGKVDCGKCDCLALKIKNNNKTLTISSANVSNLAQIVNNVENGTTIFLENGIYNVSQEIYFRKEGVSLRSVSGNRDSVIIDGRYEPCSMIAITAPNVTIADITIKRANCHNIHVKGDGNNVMLYNLHIYDAREHNIKVNPDGGRYNDFGTLACSYIEHSAEGRAYVMAHSTLNGCYSGGLDALYAWGWHVRDNLFENIYCEHASDPSDNMIPAVTFWKTSREPIVERNKFVNCYGGIALGLGSTGGDRIYPDNPLEGSPYEDNISEVGQIGGIARNNIIYNNQYYFDSGIEARKSWNVTIEHNTVYSTAGFRNYAVRISYSPSNPLIKNNLYNNRFEASSGTTPVYLNNLLANGSMFIGAKTGDLHLSENSLAIDNATDSGVFNDFDGEIRTGIFDTGADEYNDEYVYIECNTDLDCVLDGNPVCARGVCNPLNNLCEVTYNSTIDICRSSAAECDVSEYCTGNNLNCPVNSYKPVRTSCTSVLNGLCDGKGNCKECVDNSDCPVEKNYCNSIGVCVNPSDAVSTLSFTDNLSRGSYPGTLSLPSYYSKFIFNLSALPRNVTIYRAIFIPSRGGHTGDHPWGDDPTKPILVESADAPGNYLKILGPRYLTLDATAEVQRAVDSENQTLKLNIISFPKIGWGRGNYRLDITCDQPLTGTQSPAIESVSEINVKHVNGDTIITWKDPAPLHNSNILNGSELIELRKQAEDPNKIRYRIYRYTEPISSDNIGLAELVDEVDPLTVWDWRYHGHGQIGYSWDVPLYPIDNEVLPNGSIKITLADYDMGIYVRKTKQEEDRENAYYAVSRVIDGAEDFTTLTAGVNSAANPVLESFGTGMILLRERKTNQSFYYVDNATLNYYVKWEAYPNFMIPEPFDYLVAVPSVYAEKRPVDIALHEWGGWLNYGYLWWYRDNEGGLLVASNQYPYDWWSDIDENYGTIKSFLEGSAQPFSRRRLKSFVDDFVSKNWVIDENRIMLSGNSMGATGTSLWGIKTNDYFSHLVAIGAGHIPNETGHFVSSFARVYGQEGWNVNYSDTNISVWDYEDNVKWLYDNPKIDTPYMTFSDGHIAWPQSWKMVKAMIDTKKPFTFTIGRPLFPGAGDRNALSGMNFRKNQSVPAFRNGSLDGDYGTPDITPAEGSKINYWYIWDTETIVDNSTQWEMTLFLPSNCPNNSAIVDMTPRRLQNFKPAAGNSYHWENIQNGTTLVQNGIVVADENDLITIENITITKNRNRIIVSDNPSFSSISTMSYGETATLNPFTKVINWLKSLFGVNYP